MEEQCQQILLELEATTLWVVMFGSVIVVGVIVCYANTLKAIRDWR